MPPQSPLLVGSIDATTLTLALLDPVATPLIVHAKAHLALPPQLLLADQIRVFLDTHQVAVEHACLVIADDPDAPPWSAPLDADALRQVLGVRSLQLASPALALGAALPLLGPADLRVIRAGRPEPYGTRALLLSSPGFAEAFVTRDETGYQTHPSLGQQALVAPTNFTEERLLSALQSRFGQVSYAQLCAPAGIALIYGYLRQIGVADEPPWLAAQLAAASDPVALIVDVAASGQPGSSLCVATIERFVAILGTAASTLARTVVATGGVYLGGELLRRVEWMLLEEWFAEAFDRMGPGRDGLAATPLLLITNPDALLLGAALLVRDS